MSKVRKQKRAAAKEAAKPVMHGYNVSINKTCTHEERSEEEWGSWSASYDNSYESITKSDKGLDVVSTVDLTKQEGFLVWIEYSYGDSFGSANRGSTEVIALVSTLAIAKELKRYTESWNPDNSTGPERGDFFFKTKDGQEITYNHASWSGYFEQLEEVHIEEISIITEQD